MKRANSRTSSRRTGKDDVARAASSPVGKRVGGATYLHVSALSAASAALRARIERALAATVGEPWNVAKVAGETVSLLLYEDFDDVAFPALLAAVRVGPDGCEVVRTDYRTRANPPILHRKETLLLATDPRRPAFAALTRMAEERGLFVDAHRIGARNAWLTRVAEAGLEVRGARLLPREADPAEIARHRTAIPRRDLSLPMQLLMANGVIAAKVSVFDYGCGQGDDVAALVSHGFEAFGWDPHHAKDGMRRAADVVNLGFVLNVIEDRHEREETLKAAWSFARGALCVSVMLNGKVSLEGLKRYRDGYVTSRGTFQKYFGQQELRDFIEQVVGEAPVALGQGVFAVFRDKDLEQEVLLRRRSRAVARPTGMRPPEHARSTAAKSPKAAERVMHELELVWTAMLEQGRALDAEEFPPGLSARLQEARVSPAQATALCMSDLFDQEELAVAAGGRREDLLVHLSLTLFPGAPRYTSLPRSIQRDLKAFFGSHAAALQAAREMLFSVGEPDVARASVEAAVAMGMGAWRDEGTFRFFAPALNRLPAVLRVLVGCAGVLRGGTEGADFIDIKLDGPRVVFIACIDAASRLPIVAESTRIDLGKLRTTVDRSGGVVVYLKGKFLPIDTPELKDQIAFDDKLLLSGAVSENGRGPRISELLELLRNRKG